MEHQMNIEDSVLLNSRTVDQLRDELINSNLPLSEAIDKIVSAHVLLKQRDDAIKTNQNTIRALSRQNTDFQKSVVDVIMESTIADHDKETILDELGLEMPCLRWIVSFEVEIQFGEDIDNLVDQFAYVIEQTDGVDEATHYDTQKRH